MMDLTVNQSESDNPTAVRRLAAFELLVLQLLAVGYTEAQIAQLASKMVEEVNNAEVSACAALGASNVVRAIAAARAKNLIV
jgi:DNA-binding NarL/FixJ family response regulator